MGSVTDRVVAIAHRGDPVGARENTPAAFASAVTLGADMVELDLRRTRDGEIVVLHDQSLLRLWAVDASVGDLDWAEVAALRARRSIGCGLCATRTRPTGLERPAA